MLAWITDVEQLFACLLVMQSLLVYGRRDIVVCFFSSVIRDEPNVCHQIHLPAQSGSSKILEATRRGYTVESYIELVEHIRKIIPGNS